MPSIIHQTQARRQLLASRHIREPAYLLPWCPYLPQGNDQSEQESSQGCPKCGKSLQLPIQVLLGKVTEAHQQFRIDIPLRQLLG